VKDLKLVEFDATGGALTFLGDCDQMRSVCLAMCCRIDWEVGISAEEYVTGRYQAGCRVRAERQGLLFP